MTDQQRSSRSELLPCPHCGNATEPEFTDSQEIYGTDDLEGSESGWFVMCNASSGHSGCGSATGFCKTKAEAVAAWNRRALPSETREPSNDDARLAEWLRREAESARNKGLRFVSIGVDDQLPRVIIALDRQGDAGK